MERILAYLSKLLSIPSPTGYTRAVGDYMESALREMGYQPRRTNKGGVISCLGGEGDGLMLMAHLDTLGGMVRSIKANGRLRIAPLGGLQANNVEAENCFVFTRSGQKIPGTFQMDSPSSHVDREYAEKKRDFTCMELVLDAPVNSKDETAALGVMPGDIVAFDPRLVITEMGYIKSRFLDDKLSAAILLRLAEQIREQNLCPGRRVYVHFTVYEEVGHGAAASLPGDVSEILAVDMGCVGDDLGCDERKVSICAKDSCGPCDYSMMGRLIDCAKKQNLPYAVDVYPFYGSDADVALSAGYDVRHALIGPGVFASHGYERSHKEGVAATLALLHTFIFGENATAALAR